DRRAHPGHAAGLRQTGDARCEPDHRDPHDPGGAGAEACRQGGQGRWPVRRACFAVVLAAMACGHEKEQVRASPTSSPTSTAPSASNPRSRMEEPQKSTSRGVQLLTLPASGKPMVTIALRFHGGAADDPPGKAGITALAARVMSEGGTQALDSKALLLALFPLAASVDARVDKELTTFWSTIHKDNLDKLLPILIDVVAHPRWYPPE